VTALESAQAAVRSVVPAPGSARTVHDVADLALIFEPAVNIVVLRRAVPEELSGEVHRALHDPCFKVLTAVAPDTLGRGEVLAGLADLPRLASDVHSWIEMLAELTGSDQIGVRVARVDTAMCPRLHVDKVSVRVVCTYHGSGTEYVASEDVDRRWLGHASGGVPDEDSGVLLSRGEVCAASTGSVVLLKGEAWPDNAGRGAVHRSPVASPAAPRLVMTLDPL
jgi:hypothetical protein